MKQRENKTGFTLAELLIVVAIIGVLVAIAIPVFAGQLERSRQAVDMSNMRNAYAVYMAGINSGEIKQGETYFYDAVSNSLSRDVRPESYGKSTTESNRWWNGAGVALGVPKDKALQIQMDETGILTYHWGGAYAGLNITNSQEYADLDGTVKVERDLILLDTLQDEFRSMTYGQLHDLFFNGKTLKSEFSGGSFTDGRDQSYVQIIDGGMCVTIAESSIIQGEVNSGRTYHNTIYLPELFQNAGYNVSGNTKENYIITSVNGTGANGNGVNARLWVNLGISQRELEGLDESSPLWNQIPDSKKPYTYLKGAGVNTDDSVSQRTRKYQ